MKKLLKKVMAATLCMGLFLVVGCKKDNPVISGGGIEEPKPEYPIIVPFTEYTLPETCQWKNLDYNEKVIIINNDRELGIYTACEGGGYPEVDFEKQTLLLASGSASRGIEKIAVNNLRQISENDYKLSIELLLCESDTTAAEKWTMALMIEKISEESTVNLIVTHTIEYPIEIPFEDFSLFGTGCWWTNLLNDKTLIIINNDEELENYITCGGGIYPELDFLHYTLLQVNGRLTSNLISKEVQLQQISGNEYVLSVDIVYGTAAIPETWLISIKVPKLPQNATINLTVNEHP